MDNTDLTLLVVAVVLMVLVAAGATALSRYRRQMTQLEQELEALKHNLAIFNDGAQGIGRRLVEAEKQLKMVSSDQAQFKQQASSQAYSDAAQLVAQGMSAEQILAQSDLSAAEVELMILLHEKRG